MIFSSARQPLVQDSSGKLTGVFDGVGKRRDDTKLESLLGVAALDVEQRSSRQLLLVDLDVGQRSVQVATPVDQSVRSVQQAFLVQQAEGFTNSFAQVLALTLVFQAAL